MDSEGCRQLRIAECGTSDDRRIWLQASKFGVGFGARVGVVIMTFDVTGIATLVNSVERRISAMDHTMLD